jgi:hypothetical protein
MTVAAAALAAGPLMLAAPAAHAAKVDTNPSTTPGTLNCMAWQDREAHPGACENLTPTLSCVWNNGDGTFAAALGFSNQSGYTLLAPAGSYENSIYGNGKVANDVGQTPSFRPGDSTTAFVVTWNPVRGDAMQWALGSNPNTLDFTSTSGPACDQHPVPIFGNATLLGIAALTGVCAFVFWNRRSIGRREWIRGIIRAS